MVETRAGATAVAHMLGAGVLAAVVGGCSLAPPLKVPDVPTGDAYKELGPWTPAAPADQRPGPSAPDYPRLVRICSSLRR